jgi:hypothetical protein
VKPLEPADHRVELGRLCGAASKEIDTMPSQGIRPLSSLQAMRTSSST